MRGFVMSKKMLMACLCLQFGMYGAESQENREDLLNSLPEGIQDLCRLTQRLCDEAQQMTSFEGPVVPYVVTVCDDSEAFEQNAIDESCEDSEVVSQSADACSASLVALSDCVAKPTKKSEKALRAEFKALSGSLRMARDLPKTLDKNTIKRYQERCAALIKLETFIDGKFKEYCTSKDKQSVKELLSALQSVKIQIKNFNQKNNI